jgi:hypothetical protein
MVHVFLSVVHTLPQRAVEIPKEYWMMQQVRGWRDGTTAKEQFPECKSFDPDRDRFAGIFFYRICPGAAVPAGNG